MSRPWKLRGYVVERLLGAGASGEVWRARVAATGEAVALKRLVRVTPRQLRIMHTEAAVLSALEHPNVIRLHDVASDGDAPVLVLDLAEGGSLADLLAARGRLTPGEVVTALSPIAAALGYAHAQGVVHGDVSPANVLFTAGGVPLLADLGVARLLGDDTEAETAPGYIDPAVAVGCLPGPMSDVFMLGGVALHALTGVPTWRGAGAAEQLAAARAGDLSDVAHRLQEAAVPDALRRVVARTLSGDALGRGSADDVAIDLRCATEPVAVDLRAGRAPRQSVARGARAAAAAGSAARGGLRREGWAGRSAPDASSRARPAGRAGGGRHAAVTSPEPGATRLQWRALAGFEAPDELPGAAPSDPPPTVAVRARPRPQLPRPRRTAPLPRRFGPVASALLVLALLLGGAAWWRGRHVALPPSQVQSQVQSQAPGKPEPAAVEPAPAAGPAADISSAALATVTTDRPGAPRTRIPRAAPPASAQVSTDGRDQYWAGVLRTLDRRRANAFAGRDTALLRSVYASQRLLAADAHAVRSLVPPGCGLRGARTTYRDVRAEAPGTRVVAVTARATLQRGVLVCSGRRRGSTPSTGPVTMHVRLVRTSAGPRITAQWRST